MEIKTEYKRLAKLDPVNIALDYHEIDQVISNTVYKYFPEIKKIEKLEHAEHKRRVGKRHSTFIYSYFITGRDEKNVVHHKHLIYSAHSDGSRLLLSNNLTLIDQASFNEGPYRAIKPLEYIPTLKALIYEAVDGKNLYQHMREKASPEDLQHILSLTTGWIKKFHTFSFPDEIKENISLFDSAKLNPDAKTFLAYVNEHNTDQGKKLDIFLSTFFGLEKKLLKNLEPGVVYGDLHPENIIVEHPNVNHLTMIDFTDLALGDQMRDIGTFLQQLYFMGREFYDEQTVHDLRHYFLEQYFATEFYSIDPKILQRINLYQAWNSLRGFTWFVYNSKLRDQSYGMLEDAWLYLTLAIEEQKEITIIHTPYA